MSNVANLAYADELITADQVADIDRKRYQNGHYISIPTVMELWKRYLDLKGWYVPRDDLIRLHQKMVMLENPFGSGRGAIEDNGFLLPSGKVQFARATFPFDIMSLMEGMLADKHPYLTAMPSTKSHTDDRLLQYEQFMQAVFDNRMQDGSFIQEAGRKLAVTGWLIGVHPHNPTLEAQELFPYELQLLSPLGVYPRFDGGGRLLYCFIERRVTGAQLLQDYWCYPGVAELFANEQAPDSGTNAYRDYSYPGNNLLSTEFTVIRYWDDYCTALLLDGTGCSVLAQSFNPALRNLANRQSAGHIPGVSVFNGSAKWDDPYYGVLEHKLGGIPVSIVGCWPEARDVTAYEANAYAGRYVYLPFLFSQYHNWRDMSRLLSQLQTMLNKVARIKPVTDSQTIKDDGEITRIDRGSNLAIPAPTPIPQQYDYLMNFFQKQLQEAAYATSAYGASAGTSGSQQQMVSQAGTVRFAVITTGIEKLFGKYATAITKAAIFRGSDSYSVAGTGAKYQGPYQMTYDLSKIKVAPNVSVMLKSKNGFADPIKVASYKSLDDIIPMKTRLSQILEMPNPDRVMEEMRDEAAMTESRAIEPYVQEKALEAQVAMFKKIQDLQWQLEKLQMQQDVQQQMREVQLQAALLEPEMVAQRGQQELQQLHDQLMMQLGLTPPPMMPSPGGLPAMGQSPLGLPPGMGSGGPQMPSMPPGLPPGPPPMGEPTPMPALAPAMHGALIPAGPPRGYQQPLPTGPMPPMGPPPFSPSGPPALPNPSGPLSSGAGSPTLDNTATAPGQAEQPFQALSRSQPVGGVGRPGVESGLQGTAGMPLPAELIKANQAVMPVAEPKLPGVSAGTNRNPKRTRRGSRGRKK